MGKFFDPQNKFFTLVGFIGDHFLLGLLWLFCSLPVVTGGAASAAACSVSRKLWRKEEQSLLRDFFAAFRKEFGLATKLWLAVLGVGAVLAVDVAVYLPVSGSAPILLGITGLLVLCFLIVFLWIYPYMTVFQGGFVRCVKMSFLLGMANLGWSLLMLLLDGALILLTIYAPFLLPFLPGLFTLVCCGVTEKAFRKYLPKEGEV